ncbi:hypothetical protein ACFLQL_01690 [Verrucomicrobiota bacterium]
MSIGYAKDDIHAHVAKMKALYARDLKHEILVNINNPPPKTLPSPGKFFPDTGQMFRADMQLHDVRKQFVDDFFPSASPWNVGMLIPAFLGAEPVYTKATGNLWVEPVPDLYAKLEGLKYDESNRWLRDTLKRYEYYKAHLPDDCLLACETQGPDDIAKGLRSTELYYDFIDRPEEVKSLFTRVADFLVQYRRRVLAIVDHVAGGHINWQGFWVPDSCFSLTADAATNYSPEMFEKFTVPAVNRIVQAVGGFFDVHLEGSAVHILDQVRKIKGLLLLQYTNNPKLPRGLAMMDVLRSRLGDLPLYLLLTKKELLEGMQQKILTGNCIYAVGYDAEHLTDAIESPGEAQAIMRKAREYRAR